MLRNLHIPTRPLFGRSTFRSTVTCGNPKKKKKAEIYKCRNPIVTLILEAFVKILITNTSSEQIILRKYSNRKGKAFRVRILK